LLNSKKGRTDQIVVEPSKIELRLLGGTLNENELILHNEIIDAKYDL